MEYEIEKLDTHKEIDNRYNFLRLENLKYGEFNILLKKGDTFEFNKGIFVAPYDGFYTITQNIIIRK